MIIIQNYLLFNKMLLKTIQKKGIFSSKNHNLNFKKLQIITSNSNDINKNIAYESKIIDKMTVLNPILYLWQNDKNIVIGKYQNPWKECNLQKMKEDNINLARRKSGGGAVYQDLGNIVYSFILPNTPEIKDFKLINNEILSNTFNSLQIKASFSGRNDITLEEDNRKFSGNAFRIIPSFKNNPGKTLHHGTMLLDVDMNGLNSYLNVNKLKLISKGVDSVRSRVVNLKEVKPSLTSKEIYYQLEKNFIEYYNPTEIERVFLPNSDEKWDVDEDYKVMTSWEWLYGNCPSFSNSIENKFNWGLVDLSISVEKGTVIDVFVYSDVLIEGFIEGLREGFKTLELGVLNYKYDAEGMRRMLSDVYEIYKSSESMIKNDDFDRFYLEMIDVLPGFI